MYSEYEKALESAVNSICEDLSSAGSTDYNRSKIATAIDLSFGWLKVVDSVLNKYDNAKYQY
jgi:hypothetical protein